MKKTRILAALTALLLVMVSGAAGTEDPATPSDLPCDHERTQQTIYFFDGPTYTDRKSVV